MNYFVHDSNAVERGTLSILRGLFQNDGYAFWFITLECMAQSDGMSIDCSKRKNWLKYVAKCGVSEEKASNILGVLADLGAIDADLWRKKKIVWSDALVERLKSKLIRRNGGVPDKPKLKDELKKAPAAKKANKKEYAEYVSMTEEQYAKLVSMYGDAFVEKAVEILDNYKGSTGKTYKDDYRAICNWVIDETKKRHPELIKTYAAPSGTGNPFDDFQFPEGYKGDD